MHRNQRRLCTSGKIRLMTMFFIETSLTDRGRRIRVSFDCTLLFLFCSVFAHARPVLLIMRITHTHFLQRKCGKKTKCMQSIPTRLIGKKTPNGRSGKRFHVKFRLNCNTKTKVKILDAIRNFLQEVVLIYHKHFVSFLLRPSFSA